MKSKSKVGLAIIVLFLVSTILGFTSIYAVKSGKVVKVHLSAKGTGFWDPTVKVLITANIEHNYVNF